MTPPFLILAALPVFWLLPAHAQTFILMFIPHVIIQLQDHAPCTSVGGSPNPYSLLKYKREGVSWAPAINQMEETFFYPITHCGYSDGGRVLDQNRGKETRTSHKEHNFLVTGDP